MQAASAEPALPTGHLLPASWALHAPDTRALLRCVLLAVLLHVWLVLLLGNAPGGTARDGQGVWGAINVTLSGGDKRPTVQQPAPTQVVPAPGPLGTAQTPRFGGTVRDSAPPADSAPGAAQVGTWTTDVAPAAAPDLPTLATSAPATPAVPAQPLPALPAVQPLPGLPALPQLTALPALPPPATPAPPVERTLAPRAQAAVTRALEDAAALPALAPITPITAPTLSGTLPELAAPPVALRQLPALQPATPVRQAVAPLRSAAQAAPLERLPETSTLAAPPEAPPVSTVTAPLTAPLPASVPAPAPRAALAAPLPSDTQAIPRLNPVAAPRVPDLPALLASTGVADAPSAAPTATPATAAPAQPAIRATSPSSPSPSPSPSPAQGPVGLTGAPDAGPRIGQDVATPPALPASAPPRLNLDLPRARGGELSRGGSAGMLPLLPRPPELPDKLAKDIERAARDDCRNAYSGAGLLAVVPLVADALRKQGGCKW